ncbi:AcrR family transcriptional regulator [Kitasatospora gansuensis]|uniref:AcrR family transcriptional regulator n=2 Tax=Kitasatospora TaxID=2063 RepID=A0A7W7SD61_9ACTN|nr:ScbR family autoregulator-binding transcription factor [Kitasatospora gansuensis]MBB4948107.1 AcrR family transcriptional regulator [Kitasatospora gansuensis]
MPRQERAQRTRQLLIEAASASFDQAGFAMTGLNDVIRPTGISKGALYFHFGSKEQLAEAVMAESRAGLREAIRSARHSSDCPLQYLIDLSHGLARRLAEDVVFRAGLRLTDDGALAEKLRPNPHPGWALMIRRLLDRAAARQGLRPEILTDESAALLAAAGAGVEALARRDPDWLSSRVISLLWQAVLPALTTPEGLARLRTTPVEHERAGVPAPGRPHPTDELRPDRPVATLAATPATRGVPGPDDTPSTPKGRPRVEAGRSGAPGHPAASADTPDRSISSRYQGT